jgi:hypothetical protein
MNTGLMVALGAVATLGVAALLILEFAARRMRRSPREKQG